jgi:hypothetical protein
MATVEFRYDPKNTAWFTANAAMVLKAGEPAYHDTTGLFKLGDGVTALSALSFLPIVSSSTPTIQQVLTTGNVATTTIETTGFIKTGGLSTQFLKADGTVDSSTYLTTLGTAATSLTTNNSSGAATLISNVLNVPNYTLAGLGGTTLAAVNAQNLSVFAATTSSQLAGVISDETGTGALVFGTSPTFTTNITTPLINGTSGTLQIGTTDLVNIGNKTTASQRLVRIGQDTAWVDIGSVPTLTTLSGIWLNQPTPNSGNYFVRNLTASYMRINAPSGGTLSFSNGDSNYGTLGSGIWTFNPINLGSAGLIPFNITIPNQIGGNKPVGTNIPMFKVTGASSTWATGTVPLQYFTHLTANTVSAVGASTFTNVYGLYVEAATAGTNATITNNYALGLAGSLKINDTFNIVFDTTTGTKIATATTQKISFWNATPIVQPTTAVAAATVVSGTGGNVKHDDTFDGYTVEQVVRALRTIGLLA